MNDSASYNDSASHNESLDISFTGTPGGRNRRKLGTGGDRGNRRTVFGDKLLDMHVNLPGGNRPNKAWWHTPDDWFEVQVPDEATSAQCVDTTTEVDRMRDRLQYITSVSESLESKLSQVDDGIKKVYKLEKLLKTATQSMTTVNKIIGVFKCCGGPIGWGLDFPQDRPRFPSSPCHPLATPLTTLGHPEGGGKIRAQGGKIRAQGGKGW